MGRAGQTRPGAARLPAQPHRAAGTEMASGEPGTHQRSRPRALHRGAGRDGRRVADPAAYSRSHGGLGITARPPGRAAAAAASRGPNLRGRHPPARPVPRRRQPAAARGKLAQGPRAGRAAAGPRRAACPRPDRRPAAAEQLTRTVPGTAERGAVTTASEIGVASDGQVASDVLLLGAAGNTGRRIAADLAARGLSVRLAGRRRGPLEDLARALAAEGATTDVRTVDLGDAASLAEAIAGVGVVLSTIGPF